MKLTKVFALVIALAVVLSVPAFAAYELKIDIEDLAVGYAIGEHEGDDFWRSINSIDEISVVEFGGSKVVKIDNTTGTPVCLRFYGQGHDDNKPVDLFGKVFTFTYRIFIDGTNAGGLVFKERVTDSNDNEGFEVLKVWANAKAEASDGTVFDFSFGEWHTVAETYDITNQKITTYLDQKEAVTQNLPGTNTGSVDWTAGLCFMTLGAATTDQAGITYLDDMTWYSGEYKDKIEGGSAATADITAVVALAGVISLAGAVVCKKK